MSKDIVRFTGDDDPHALLIEIKKIGDDEATPLDLALATSIQFAFKKADGAVIVYTCTKDADLKSGLVYVPFVDADVNMPAPKGLDYDVQAVWAANGKKKTLGKAKLILNEDVNKG